MALRDWCIWKALEEACPAATTILADFIVLACLWLGFVTFHLLAQVLVPSDLLSATEEVHKLGTWASYAAITSLGVIRLIRVYWP